MTSRTHVVAVCEGDKDTALVQRAREGSREAFEQLYLRYKDRIYRICLHLCADREEAADLLQETFINAWRGMPRFAGRASFATWLHRIAVNACRGAMRRRKNRPAEIAIEHTEDEAMILGVRAVIARLRPNHRIVLVLRYGEGLTYKELAECLGWPLGRVKATLHRAKCAFKEEFLQSEGRPGR